MVVKEVGWEKLYGNYLVQSRIQWQVPGNGVMNLRIPSKEGNFLNN
jgi:hypothetical protein